MNLEIRRAPVLVRAATDQPGLFEAVVMRYGVVDDYRTVFDPGVFSASLADRLPRIAWGHDWTDVIGRVVDYRDTDTELTLIGQLDDFDAVPRARQAYAQLLSGTIDEFSVGFRVLDDYTGDDGLKHFRAALLDEVSLVLAGAVPGTQLLAVRHQERTVTVPQTLVVDLAAQVAAGTLTKDAALIALDLAAGDSTVAPLPPASSDEAAPPTVLPLDGPAGGLEIDQADRLLDDLGLG